MAWLHAETQRPATDFGRNAVLPESQLVVPLQSRLVGLVLCDHQLVLRPTFRRASKAWKQTYVHQRIERAKGSCYCEGRRTVAPMATFEPGICQPALAARMLPPVQPGSHQDFWN